MPFETPRKWLLSKETPCTPYPWHRQFKKGSWKSAESIEIVGTAILTGDVVATIPGPLTRAKVGDAQLMASAPYLAEAAGNLLQKRREGVAGENDFLMLEWALQKATGATDAGFSRWYLARQVQDDSIDWHSVLLEDVPISVRLEDGVWRCPSRDDPSWPEIDLLQDGIRLSARHSGVFPPEDPLESRDHYQTRFHSFLYEIITSGPGFGGYIRAAGDRHPFFWATGLQKLLEGPVDGERNYFVLLTKKSQQMDPYWRKDLDKYLERPMSRHPGS